MCEQTEIQYLDGEVVWVKLGACWWPGEVVGSEKLPPDVLSSFRKPPIAVVKFFKEDTYEYVKNINSIYKYNCSRKDEFIRKGLSSFRSKRGNMEKFPDDIVHAESVTDGDTGILTREDFQETKKAKYSDIFGDPAKKTPVSAKKGRGRPLAQKDTPNVHTPVRKFNKGNSDYKVHILVQTPKPAPSQPSEASTPSTSRAGSEPADDKPDKPEKTKPTVSTPVATTGQFTCHACSFTTTRMNVMVLHNKSHSSTFTPYIPTPVRKKPAPKDSPKATPTTSKTPKARRPKNEKTETEKKPKGKKRSADAVVGDDAKKSKTDAEIKSSLLADWDDEGDGESNDESSSVVLPESPEIPVAAESPAVEPAELTSAVVPSDSSSPIKKQSDDSSAEKASSDSKYEFCEDEDWAVEAEGGRRIIPRIKNTPKRKSESKSVSIDDEDLAKEVAELLSKTKVPELPSAPEPLKAEENFPEPSLVKSPDKQPARSVEVTKSPERVAEKPVTKTIFKTKTFFRSRHSRSQDAIGKYVAEQLNAAERMNTSESDINGSEVTSSPEARDSPTADTVKVTRLAPKIQLKRMKAELAQQAERERLNAELKTYQSSELTDENKELVINAEINDYVLRETIPQDPISGPDKTVDRYLKMSKASLKTFDDDAGNSEITAFESYINTHVLNNTEETCSRTDAPSNTIEPKINTTQPEVSPVSEVRIDSIEAELDPKEPETKSSVSETQNIQIDDTHEHGENTLTVEADQIPDSENYNEISEVHKPIEEPGNSTTKIDINSTEPEHTTLEIDHSTIDEKAIDSNNKDKQIEEPCNSTTKIDINSTEPEHATLEIDHSTIDEKAIDSNNKDKQIEEPCNSTTKIDINSTEPEHDTLEIVHSAIDEKAIDSDNKDVENDHNHTDPCDNNTIKNLQTVENNNELVEYDDITLGDVPKTIGSENIVTETVSTEDTEINFPKTNIIEPEQTPELVQEETNGDDIVIEEPKESEATKLIQPQEQFLNESTASAVDALLSVSRDADKVANAIGDDPPENLFEDDKLETNASNENGKDSLNNGVNNFSLETIEEASVVIGDKTRKVADEIINDFCDSMDIDLDTPVATEEVVTEETSEEPTESDLQIAEALMNLPSTALKIKAKQDLHITLPSMSFESQEPEVPVVSGSSLLKNSTSPDYTMKQASTVSELDASLTSADNRFESEQELSENYNAAQSLVQMSEAVDLKLNSLLDTNAVKDKSVGKSKPILDNDMIRDNSVEQNVAALGEANQNESIVKPPKYETTSSKLLKMLEEPSAPRLPPVKTTPTKLILNTAPVKEKILNFDVATSPLKSKPQTNKQKIIIRRTVPNKNLINNMSDPAKPEKIVLSRTNKPTVDGPSVQTYTIQASADTPSDSNTIVIQQKMRTIVQTPKLQKIKPQTLVAITQDPSPVTQTVTTEEALFDINSMPIVLSDDILTPENIEMMPIVMSDGNIISNPLPSPSKHKPKQTMTQLIDPLPQKPAVSTHQGNKTLLMSSTPEPSKSKHTPTTHNNTPNILSKSSKLRGSKPMLVIDQATGTKKIIMTKPDPPGAVRELKKMPSKIINQAVTNRVQSVPTKIQAAPKIQAVPTKIKPMPAKLQPLPKMQTVTTKLQTVAAKVPTPAKVQSQGKSEKFIIMPTPAAPRAGRAQKIVIDPHTGKAHVLVGKEPPADNKPVSAKLIPSAAESGRGGTVMIITNAQGTQSRIVLTPEHEKLLFPNKQAAPATQPKPAAAATQFKSATQAQVPAVVTQVTSSPAKPPQQRIVAKQKNSNAIITSKGQLIVGGRVATTARNLSPAPPPEPRPAPAKRPAPALAPAKAEPLIFLQQKSGAVMQLTAAQFEHLQRTGQIVQKTGPPPAAPPADNKITVQKSVTLKPNDPAVPTIRKQKSRSRPTAELAPAPALASAPAYAPALALAPAPSPALAYAPAPARVAPPPLAPISCPSAPAASTYADLDNLEDLLPCTSIARPQETPAPAPAPAPEPVPEPEPSLPPVHTDPAPPAPAPPPPPPPPPPPALGDGHLLAVPGEHFGGPPNTFYLCFEDAGTLTPIDSQPLVLEDNQLVPMSLEPEVTDRPVPAPRRDILEAALANSDVFHAEGEIEPAMPAVPAAPAHCIVSETSTTLHRPIMSPAEAPRAAEPAVPPVPARGLDAGLAVIGVTSHAPTTLELPITVTDPRIAARAADPLAYLPAPAPAPAPAAGGAPISMPLLIDDDEQAAGKSMPILTDECGGGASPADSAGSPEGWGGACRLHTPGSDTSDASAEIPLQPAIQISVSELAGDS